MLNFEPHKPTYKISIEVGRSVGRSFIARIQPTIIRLTLRRSAIIPVQVLISEISKQSYSPLQTQEATKVQVKVIFIS